MNTNILEHQLEATITVLLISKISSTCFGQTFAHLQERKPEIFTTYGIMSCKNENKKSQSCAPEDGQMFARNTLS
jgi:hypothetical protein